MINTFELKTIALPNGETMGYREAGKGDKVFILVHGNMSSSKHMEILMERLQDKYKLYAVDMRGFGASSYIKEIDYLKDFSEDIKLFVDLLKLKSFSMAGWSTGGGVIMQFAADYPEYVEKLVLIESVGIKGYPMFKKDEKGQPIFTERLATKAEIAADIVQVSPVLAAYASKNKEFMRMIWNMSIYSHNQPEPGLYEEYLEDMMTQRNLVDVDHALVHFNISNEHNGVVQGNGLVDKIQCPVLVLQGDRDYVVPRQMGEEIAAALKERAKLVIFENSGHSPLIDCMEVLVKNIIEFV